MEVFEKILSKCFLCASLKLFQKVLAVFDIWLEKFSFNTGGAKRKSE